MGRVLGVMDYRTHLRAASAAAWGYFRASLGDRCTSAPCGEWATFSTSSMSERRTTLRGKLLRLLLIPMSLLFLLDEAGSYVLASRLADRVYLSPVVAEQ